ncbi:hypothetical protein PVK06_042950 [Gossypium arboreum]|uniref:Uncharacterized protein n=1 Tax=Gossypium arboreum TaxID=29729 RepID=A0ABR0MML6_GOSAR|nr:hypothetical protein PVK06_042950 [Gossypium arboreum]
MCAAESSNGSQKCALSKLSSFLQALLAKATMISLDLDESVNGVEANQKELEGSLESTYEQYLKMIEENEVLYKQNGELTRKLRAAQRNDKLSKEVMAERERNEALDAELKRTAKEHKATVSQIIVEHEVAIASLKQKQAVALKQFNKKTLEILSSLTLELKSNILLHTQVVVGPFNACKVDFDALYEGPIKLNFALVDDNTIATLAEHIEIVERGEREDKITGDLEGRKHALISCKHVLPFSLLE